MEICREHRAHSSNGMDQIKIFAEMMPVLVTKDGRMVQGVVVVGVLRLTVQHILNKKEKNRFTLVNLIINIWI